MWTSLKQNAAELLRARPGERFGARHRSWRARRSESYLATAVYLAAGMLAIVLGIVFSFSPILPGFVFVVAGLAILSTRLSWLAFRLDRLELACRRLLPRGWLRQAERAEAPPGPAQGSERRRARDPAEPSREASRQRTRAAEGARVMGTRTDRRAG